MKLSKIFAVIFAVLGILLMTVTAGLCILNRNAQPKLNNLPPDAAFLSESLMEALASGDYTTAQSYLYGQPDLGLSAAPGTEAGAEVWKVFQNSFTFQFTGGCYVEGSNIYRNVTITTLDISAYTEALPQIARDLLEKRVAEAEDLTVIYDENDEYRPEILEAVMAEASKEALASAGTVTYEVKLGLIQREGHWWVVPDKTLLKAISGGLA